MSKSCRFRSAAANSTRLRSELNLHPAAAAAKEAAAAAAAAADDDDDNLRELHARESDESELV